MGPWGHDQKDAKGPLIHAMVTSCDIQAAPCCVLLATAPGIHSAALPGKPTNVQNNYMMK
jgi:hypothetical protein